MFDKNMKIFIEIKKIYPKKYHFFNTHNIEKNGFQKMLASNFNRLNIFIIIIIKKQSD